MTEQLQTRMNEMKMNEKETSSSLKTVNTTMNDILTKSYGMREDHTYVVPLKVSRNAVAQLELKRDREIDDVHNDIKKLRNFF